MKSNILLLSLPLVLAKGSQKPIANEKLDFPLPRGVNPSFTDKFRPSSADTFTCLSNPSIQIPYSQVNDDYCDCPDGTDEPGTAACSHLNHTVNPLPGFYCANKGHIPAYIPFNRINDGICDYDFCCDGSDEWNGVGGVSCPDKCAEIGKEARKHAEIARQLAEKGLKAYQGLVERAVLVKKEVEDKIAALTGEVARAEGVVQQKKRELEQAEKEEKNRVATPGDGKNKGSQLIQFSKDRINELKDKARKLKEERDQYNEQMLKLEKILETFKSEYNPNFNDEGVKRTVKAWEDYLADESGWPDGTVDDDLDTMLEEEINWEEWAIPESEDTIVEEMYKIESYLPPPLRSWVHAQLSSIHDFLIENGLLAHKKSPAPSGVSQRVQNLQNSLSSAETEVSNKRNTLNGLTKDLTKDYGHQSVFRALKEKCVDASSGEYTYSYCHLDRAHQKNRDGHSTHLGNWEGFDVRWDDEVEADVVVIKYERGARCWNGPERSAYVYLRCAPEEKLLSIIEAEKCVYKFVAEGPAVCGEGVVEAMKAKLEAGKKQEGKSSD